MTTITIKTANYSANAIGFSLPVDGAVYGNFFGTGIDPVRNLMAPSQPGTLVGAPVMETYGMRCTGATAHVISPITPNVANPFTLIAAYSWSDAALAAPVISNYSNDSSGVAILARRGTSGDNLYQSSGLIAGSNGGVNSNVDLANTPYSEAVGSVAIAGLSYDPTLTVLARFRVHAPLKGFASSVPQGSPTITTINAMSNPWRIGAHRGGTLNGAQTIRAAFIFNRVLSDAEVGVMGSFLGSYYTRRGLAV